MGLHSIALPEHLHLAKLARVVQANILLLSHAPMGHSIQGYCSSACPAGLWLPKSRWSTCFICVFACGLRNRAAKLEELRILLLIPILLQGVHLTVSWPCAV